MKRLVGVVLDAEHFIGRFGGVFMNQHMPGVRIAFAAFLDNLSGAALFGKLRWPGAPSEMIDSRTVEEYLASGEFEEYLECINASSIERRRPAG